MNNYDEVLGSNKSFDKNEWKKQKQEERQNAYNLAEETAGKIQKSMPEFQKYLDIQSRFDKYSVNNALLILAQRPDATRIKDSEDWRKDKVSILKGEKGFTILEPGENYTRPDGTQATYFNPKKEFDITQTNSKYKERVVNYDDKTLLQAFLNECPVDVKAVDNLAGNVIWSKEDNVLYIQKGLDSPQLFRSLSKELATIEFDDGSNQLKDFKSYCVSYMICKKYNIDVKDYKYNDIPQALKDLDTKEFKNELSNIRESMTDVNSRMGNYFESISKENRNKEQER